MTRPPPHGDVHVASDEAFCLAEGPLWDPAAGLVRWVDISAGSVLAGQLDERGRIRITDRFAAPDTAGAIALATTGEMVIAGKHRLYYRDLSGTLTAGPRIASGAHRRLNDGKPDPAGRLVVGTLTELGGSQDEFLVRVEPDGEITVIDDDLTLSNGLAWSPDGTLLYSIDTMSQRIFVRDYDAQTGAVGPRGVFATIGDGFPDGLTIDDAGCVWIAIWGGSRVIRLDPAGRPLGELPLPVPHVSSVAFVGPALDTLLITTAYQGLSREQRDAAPLSGHLFTARVGATGVPPLPWAGPPARGVARRDHAVERAQAEGAQAAEREQAAEAAEEEQT